MKKKQRKKSAWLLQKNLLILISGIFLLSVSMILINFSSTKQDVRSRAATGPIQFIGASSNSTGSGPSHTISISVPGGSQQGDLMLAILQADYGHIGGALPSGWKLIDERNENNDLTIHAYYKFASGQEPSSYTWNVVSIKNGLGAGSILTFRNVHPSTPIGGSVINGETRDPSKMECPSINAPKGGMLVCGFTHDDDQPDIRVPGSMTRVSNFIIRHDDAHAVAYEAIPAAGATGSRVANINGSLCCGKNDIEMALVLVPMNGEVPVQDTQNPQDPQTPQDPQSPQIPPRHPQQPDPVQVRPEVDAPPPPPCIQKGSDGNCEAIQTPLGALFTLPSQFIARIFAVILSLAGGIGVLLIIRAGYRILTSHGKPEAIQQGRDELIAVIVGLLFMIFAFMVLGIIGGEILKIPGFK